MGVDYYKEQLGKSILALTDALDACEDIEEKARINSVLVELCRIYEGK